MSAERAFPHPEMLVIDPTGHTREEFATHCGMTLRDYFAAAALTGIVLQSGDYSGPQAAENMAIDAYHYADAMLAERGKPKD